MVDCRLASVVLVPVLSLGRRVVATEGSGEHSGTYTLAAPDVAAGGRTLHVMTLDAALFADGGEGGLSKDLMAMKVTELREELRTREEPVSGNKAWLRRRLHAAIVRDYLEARADEGI